MPKPISILMYHSIESEAKGSVLRSLSVPKTLFKVQLYTLKLLGYKGLSMSELTPYIEGKENGKVFGITFDDGYLNNYENALPVLKKLKYSATCYIVADNIGGTNYWDHKLGVSKKQMMNHDHISNWLKSGMEIGSHSSTHLRLSKCDALELKKEILGSKEKLENIFHTKVNHFCYPYGDFSKEVLDEVKKSKYTTATTVNRGRVNEKSNLYALPRVLVNHRTYPFSLLLKFFTSYEDRRG